MCNPKGFNRSLQGFLRGVQRGALGVCIANTDDHLRNHGFLREDGGWVLSPAYDLNPVPADVRPRILTTNVTLDWERVARGVGASRAECQRMHSAFLVT